MKELTDVRYIEHNGVREFAVIKYDEFLAMMGEDESPAVPSEVVNIAFDDECNAILAWRKYLRITQKDLAKRMGLSPSALCQMEKSGKINKKTRDVAAKALGIVPEQLDW